MQVREDELLNLHLLQAVAGEVYQFHPLVRQFAGEYVDDPLSADREGYITKLLARLDKYTADSLYFYDQQGTTSPDKVIAMARYCAVELGVQHIFIDSLMKCVKNEDRPKDSVGHGVL